MRRRAGTFLLLMSLVAGCASRSPEPAAGWPDNFHQVDARLYRGAQPSEGEFRKLRDERGVVRVVNLNSSTAESERGVGEKLGMEYVGVPMRADRVTWAELK